MRNLIKSFACVMCVLLVPLAACKKTEEKPGPQPDPAADQCPAIVIDIDGNQYTTVKIGSRCWMAQNLKTTRYRDGSPIATGLSDAQWETATTGAYAVYDNSPANDSVYGKLYNWHAVNTGKLAPPGWHVATAAEWQELLVELGGASVAGGAIKTTTHWLSPNAGATNSSGYSGLPGGNRGPDGSYNLLQHTGYWWHATPAVQNMAWIGYTSYYISHVNSYYVDRSNGASVRCVKDY